MKKRINYITLILGLSLLGIYACEKTLGPNEIGGDTNLELTKVGGHFASWISIPGEFVAGFNHLNDTVVITKNDAGIVTTHVDAGFDTQFVTSLDSVFGTKDLPSGLRSAVIDTYKRRFNATIDTSNPEKRHVSFDLKMKITSEGIQEFVSSNNDLSRPYTIIKYAANVGDKYEFTNSEGIKVTRTVTSKSTTDDYPVGFYLIKVSKIEETKEDVFVDKVTYITNHKFGLVGVIIKTKNGKTMQLGLIPPNM